MPKEGIVINSMQPARTESIDFRGIAASLLSNAPALLKQWLPNGRLQGREFVVGNLDGAIGTSLSINIDTGLWSDFSTLDSGADLIALYAAIHKIGQAEAARMLSNTQQALPAPQKPVTQPDTLIIGTRYEKLPKHKLGNPSGVWDYLTPEGDYYCSVCRFETPEGKQFAPLSYWKTQEGKQLWRWKKPTCTIYPYKIEAAIKFASAKILIVEGEKKADAAQKLLPEWVVLGFMGGALAITKTNWSAIKNRDLFYWPDADDVGQKAANLLKRELPNLTIVTLPEGLPNKWDLADADNNFPVLDYLQPKRQVALVKQELAFIEGTGKNQIICNGHYYFGESGSINNAFILCMNDKALESVIVYNVFADDIFLVKCPPWEIETGFNVHKLEEQDTFRFRAWMERRGIKLGNSDTERLITTIAMQNIIDPAKDYFESLKWDGKKRLDKWLETYIGAAQQDDKYLITVGSKWLIAGVARVYDPGCKFDHVLILEGAQGIGKSPAFEELATINGERYFIDESVDFSNKDSLMKLQGKLIFEMSELASLRKVETDEVKAFLGRRIDLYRPPYGRKVVSRNRRFIIGGSVNPIGGYLKDHTGGKRYWPVECGDIDMVGLRRDKEQLWAEAVYRYKQKEQYWLTHEEYELAKNEQADRLQQDILSDDVAFAVKEVTIGLPQNHIISVSEVASKMGATSTDKKTYMVAASIKNWLISNGYVSCRPRQPDGTRPERWVRANYKSEVMGRKKPETNSPELDF